MSYAHSLRNFSEIQVRRGRVRLEHSSTMVTRALTLVEQGTLDLSGGALVIDYGESSPLQVVRAAIASAYASGAWDGSGLTSSLADAAHYALGCAESNSIFTTFPATFLEVPVDASAVLVRRTRYGDADLDSAVNLADFNRLAASFGSADLVWTQGDFNYDGAVNLADFNLLAANFGLAASGPTLTPQDWSAVAAAVPEPALPLLAAPTLALLRRPRRSAGCYGFTE